MSRRDFTGEYVQGQSKFRRDGTKIPFECRRCGEKFWRKDDLSRHTQSGCATKGDAKEDRL